MQAAVSPVIFILALPAKRFGGVVNQSRAQRNPHAPTMDWYPLLWNDPNNSTSIPHLRMGQKAHHPAKRKEVNLMAQLSAVRSVEHSVEFLSSVSSSSSFAGDVANGPFTMRPLMLPVL